MDIIKNLQIRNFDFRKYLLDLLVLLAIFVLLALQFYWYKKEINLWFDSHLPFRIETYFMTAWFLLFLFLNKFIKSLISNTFSIKEYRLDQTNNEKCWEHQGYFEIAQSRNLKSLVVIDNNCGCLLNGGVIRKYLWKNFKAKFKIEFPGDGYKEKIGIIFRAQDLENYIMLQIHPEDKINSTIFYLFPHIRFNGNLDIIQSRALGDVNVIGKRPKDTFQVLINVENNKVNLSIDNQKFNQWLIPEFVDPRFKQYQDLKQADTANVPRLFFGNIAGKFGFRNYSDEKALVSELEIRSIN